mgnify:CR=1 FL=1
MQHIDFIFWMLAFPLAQTMNVSIDFSRNLDWYRSIIMVNFPFQSLIGGG